MNIFGQPCIAKRMAATFFSLLSFGLSCAQDDVDVKTVAVISDGASWYFDGINERVERHLKEFAAGSYQLNFKELNAENDADKAEELLGQALVDDSVDVVYLAGVIGTERALKIAREAGDDPAKQFKKPILAGAVQFSDSRAVQITATGASGLKNLTFISNPRRIESDLSLLKSLSSALTLYVLIDERMIPEIQNLDEAQKKVEEVVGAKAEFLGAPDSVNGALAAIPKNARAVYVTILPHFDKAERKALFKGLAERGIISVSMLGVSDVRIGVMAGLGADTIGFGDDDDPTASPSNQALPRRIALNIHQMLLGVSTDGLPVYLPVQDRLVLNREVATQVGWSPTYEEALRIDFINEGAAKRGEKLTLQEAMKRASDDNAETKIARAAIDVAEQDIGISRSSQLPQVTFESQHAGLRVSDQISLQTPDRSHQGTYGIQIRQVLFNDKLRSGIAATRQAAVAAELDAHSTRLDAVESVSLAYLDLLIATRLSEIEKANLNLTRNNLEAARLRLEIGGGQNSEVYRWEQSEASGHAALFQRNAERGNAQIELNRIMGTPREKIWSLEDIELADDEFYFLEDSLTGMINNEAEFLKFGSFLQKVAVEQSPELLSFDRSLYAQGIILEQRKRSFFLPEVAGFASQNRFIQGADTFDTSGQNESTIGISMNFPIFEGGLKKAEVSQKEAEIRQLLAQRERAIQLIEQKALVSVNGIGASHPNIRFSRRGYSAALKNYESAQEKYSQGATGILELLDAQASLLSQKQQAEVAVYQYLQQIHQLQRSISWFEFEASTESKASFENAFRSYLVNGSSRKGSSSSAVSVSRIPEAKIQQSIREAANPEEKRSSEPRIIATPLEEPKPKKKGLFRLFQKQQ